MDLGDLKNMFSPTAFFSSLFVAFVSVFIAPKLGITDTNQILYTSVGICFVIWAVLTLILHPIAEVEFVDAMNPLVLDRRGSINSRLRADDLKFNVKPSKKVKLFGVFRIFHINISHFSLQIYWAPSGAFQYKPLDDYNTLSNKDGFPSICLDNFEAEHVTNYSLKFSCTPQYQETTNTKISVKIVSDPENIRSKLLKIFFFGIKSRDKEVIIKNKN